MRMHPEAVFTWTAQGLALSPGLARDGTGGSLSLGTSSGTAISISALLFTANFKVKSVISISSKDSTSAF